MEILSKATIETCILPHLTVGTRGFEPKVPLYQIVMLILYRLKTGSQWPYLPLKEVFTDQALTWQGVFYHYNKWSKQGCRKSVWIDLLKANPDALDLSCVQLDGSHTPTKNGGQARIGVPIGYQPRKAANTTNALFLADNTGQPLAMPTPQAGNQHDLFEIQPLVSQLGAVLEEAGIRVRGLFVNADPGFDSVAFRSYCVQEEIEVNIKSNPRTGQKESTDYQYVDDELYQRRVVVEQTNAWLDSFKALLVRFETSLANWMSLHWLAFSVLFVRKITRKLKV